MTQQVTIVEIATRSRRARIAHFCTVCGQPIAIGSRYTATLMRDPSALKRKDGLHFVKYHTPRCPPEVRHG